MLESRVAAAIGACQGLIPDEELKDMRSLVYLGEPGVAIENLSVQLYEYEARVDEDVVMEIKVLGEKMGLDPKCWERLFELLPNNP